MPYGVYKESGICLRNYCGAKPPGDTGPPDLFPAVGGRDRAPASYAAADCLEALARAARRRFCGIHGGRAAPSVPAEAGTTSAGGCLAGPVPPVLVGSHRCSRTPPRSHASNSGKRKNQGENGAAQTANVIYKEKGNEN